MKKIPFVVRPLYSWIDVFYLMLVAGIWGKTDNFIFAIVGMIIWFIISASERSYLKKWKTYKREDL